MEDGFSLTIAFETAPEKLQKNKFLIYKNINSIKYIITQQRHLQASLGARDCIE
jgi:hypothetical protein